MKHLWSLCTLFLASCSLTATPETSPLPTLPPRTPRPTTTATSPPRPEYSLLTLTLWVPDLLDPYTEDSSSAILESQIATFSQVHPDIQTQIIVKRGHGPGGLYNLLSTAYEAAPSILPDLIILETPDLRAAIHGGFVHPMTITPENKKTYFASALESVTNAPDDLTFYGLPYVAQGDLMMYRKEVSATPPLSWTIVLTAGYSMLLPASPPSGVADDTLLAIYLSTGGAVMNEKGKPLLERVHLEELYRFLARMVDMHLLDPNLVSTLPDAAACAEEYRAGLSRLCPVPTQLYWTDNWPRSRPTWPPTPDGKPTGIVHTWSLAIVTVDPTRHQAALRLAQWLSAPEQMARLTQATGLWPTRFQALELWDTMPEETTFLKKFLEKAHTPPPISVNEPVRKALQAGLTAILSGEVDTPEKAADYALTVLHKAPTSP